ATSHLPCHLLLHSHPHHPALPSFPTRRSSDLLDPPQLGVEVLEKAEVHPSQCEGTELVRMPTNELATSTPIVPTTMRWIHCLARSEEHTSELQSRFDLVCRLLLEKKKKKKKQQ